MTETTTGTPTRTTARPTTMRGWVALLLLTAGAVVLAGRVWPLVGDALALVLGVELLAWSWAAREDGQLIGGGIATGVGTGVLLAAGPIEDAAPNVIGGTILFCLAAGFALVGILSRLWLARSQTWAWITAAAVATVGGALFAGPEVLSQVITWALPVILLLGGLIIGVRWLRNGRR
jgi:hypothetical protein